MTMDLSPDQQQVFNAIYNYIQDPHGRQHQYITVGGYAGTGKTTIINEVAAKVGKTNLAFCAYTGKAAQVLSSKLMKDGEGVGYCGTIHRLMYRPITHEHEAPKCQKKTCKIPELTWKKRIDGRSPDLEHLKAIIVDEASMLTEQIFKDILSLRLPLVFVGDHGQLPPVTGSFNLMQRPMHRLDKIHRQAEGNPIIKLSLLAREEGAIPMGDFSSDGQHAVRKVHGMQHIDGIELDDVMLLCGLNRTRNNLNNQAREGKPPMPESGERVICLKNNADAGIYNGMQGWVVNCEPASTEHHYDIEVDFRDGGEIYDGRILKYQFGQPKTLTEHPNIRAAYFGDMFDYGYCLTVHKAQGSEADSVVLIEENMHFLKGDNYRRWLYTAVTRARKDLLIIKP